MSELSVFVDESGNCGNDAKYYLVTLVFHDQADAIREHIGCYERVLADKGLPDIPLHMNPLMRANEDYKGMDIKTRLRLLSSFATFAVKCPFTYACLAYPKDWFSDDTALFATMRRDLVLLLFDNLPDLQRYDAVKLYYDDGQELLADVLHKAFEYALGSQVVTYRDCSPRDYRLQQTADYICEVELAAIKYSKAEQGNTEKLIFGVWRDFNKNHLKKLRKKKLN